MHIDTDVAVIGAGLAGLTAARILRRAGVDGAVSSGERATANVLPAL
jgi:flavin-dependent dehydrogenase